MTNQYSEEAKEKYGQKIVEDSEARVASWSPEYKKAIFEEGEQLAKSLAALMTKPADSLEVQALIAQHHGHICRFYDCGFKQYRGLGEMYIADARFTAYFDQYAQGLAQFIEQAIQIYCDNEEAKLKKS